MRPAGGAPERPDGTASTARRRAFRRGLAGEAVAAWYLRLKGYRILAWRYRTAAGEIDLVARRGRTLVFVEVKARSGLAGAEDPVTAESGRRIAAAADVYLARNPRLAVLDQRFDLLVVAPWRWPRHEEGRL